MKKTAQTSHPISGLFSLLLFGLFVLFLLIMLLFSAQIYQQSIKKADSETDLGTVSSYIATKFRQHDVQDGILEPDDPRISKWYKDYDKMFRINHTSWWKEELPSEEEMTEGMMNLEQNGSQVDYIITHSPYTSALRQMDQGSGVYKTDILTDYLQEIKESVEYKKWFFGHYHGNMMIPGGKDILLYEQFIQIN